MWMFQYQVHLPPPRRGYDLLGEIANGRRTQPWRAQQHRRRLQKGERIYFLRGAGGEGTLDAAIVAVGSILSEVKPSEGGHYPWRVDVQFDALVNPPLSRGEMRNDAILSAYAPFTLGSQGTQFPLPLHIAARTQELVHDRLTLLAPTTQSTPQPDDPLSSTGKSFGRDYQIANEDFSASLQDTLIRIDPERVDRANSSHRKLQNTLASHLQERHLAPRSYDEHEPNFDIGWVQGDTIFVAEVKSLTEENEEMQLRLGLSQVLMYRHRLARVYPVMRVRAVLLVEREPTFAAWNALCGELGVLLVWPANLNQRL